jgi:signal transduction histidine kinase
LSVVPAEAGGACGEWARVRFDDMLATVLAQPAKSNVARSAKWRQLVDLLAQPRIHSHSAELAEAIAFLRKHRGVVDAATRKEIAHTLAGRRVSPLLLRFFGEDDPSIAIPIVGTARLAAEEWIELLPSMSVTARALLRHRRDLPPEVGHALASFGASDFVLSGSPGLAAANETFDPELGASEAQIRDMVARIEAFQKSRPPLAPDGPATVETFRWETGPDGVIIWVEDAPRGPLIGQTIATIAARGQFGVDGQAAGAFEKRAPFRDARFSVPGNGAAAGDWRISGVPFFHPRQGSFLGYRGSARRPRLDEVARSDSPAAVAGLFGTNLPAESLRQLIHELRTPLNAIVGFAEMIDGQFMGPADSDYRARARQIIEQAGNLLAAVDDLDTAARIETQRLVLDESVADTAALLVRLHEAYVRVAKQRRAKIHIELATDLPSARVEIGAVERMFARLLAATIGLARQRETIAATMGMAKLAGNDMLCLTIDRPRAIAGIAEVSLLDPGYSPKGDWPGAPALGLGFALRLVRNLAEAAGGALEIGESRFFLYLPPVEETGHASGQSG